MSTKDYLNTIISAGIAGGIAAVAEMSTNGFQIDWKKTGSTFAAGALVGIVQHFRSRPGTISIPAKVGK